MEARRSARRSATSSAVRTFTCARRRRRPHAIVPIAATTLLLPARVVAIVNSAADPRGRCSHSATNRPAERQLARFSVSRPRTYLAIPLGTLPFPGHPPQPAFEDLLTLERGRKLANPRLEIRPIQ